MNGCSHACRDGCHNCGSRMGRDIGDHIPPNKYVNAANSAVKQITANLGITNNTHIPPFGKLRCDHTDWQPGSCHMYLEDDLTGTSAAMAQPSVELRLVV